MVSSKEYDHLFKFLIIGSTCTGKTQLLLRFSDNLFSDSYLSTIGVDFKIRTIQVMNKQVKLQIWDTSGQERFKNITSSYYKGAHTIIIVFDITNQESFDNIPKYLEEKQKHSPENAKVIIVGNKSDLSANRIVQYSDAQNFAESKNLPYFEVSAKTGEGVYNIFESASQTLINNQEINDAKPQKTEEKPSNIFESVFQKLSNALKGNDIKPQKSEEEAENAQTGNEQKGKSDNIYQLIK